MNKIDRINQTIKHSFVDTGKISDGFHTFDELYEHRITLFITLCKVLNFNKEANNVLPCADIWKSIHHSDGSVMDGWFLLGINKEKGRQITYHLPMSRWDECEFATTLHKAPEFDGHSSQDVLEGLKAIL